MVKKQKEYLKYIEIIESIVTNLNIDRTRIFELKKSIKEAELIVPCVGAFSAGKSTLINSFLGETLLPTALTPETSLATELRYAEKEYIEAIKGDGSKDTYEISEIEQIKENADKYQYLRMYISNSNIKNIEPLVLVDMPGFDSPIELHNQAILSYLRRGIYFIVLTSIEDGGLSKSLLRELRNIVEFGKGFTFCLGKTNLRPIEDVKLVQSKIEEQIEDELDFRKKVILTDDNGGENLSKILKSIDTEKLFESIFIDILKSNYFQLESTINTTISTLGASKEDASSAIESLQESIQSIVSKKDSMVEDIEDRYSNRSLEHIISSVSKELIDNEEYLVSLALRDNDSFSREINEIIKARLIYEIKSNMEDLSEDIINDFNMELKALDSDLSSFAIDDVWIDRISKSSETLIKFAQEGLGKLSDITKDKDGKIYKVITTVLGITTSILNPALEVLIIFLPEIISFFGAKSKEARAKEEISNKFRTEIIPSLKVKLRGTLSNVLNEQIKSLIESISLQFEEELTQKREEISHAMQEKEEKMATLDTEIEKLQNVKKEIQALTTKTLYGEQ